MRRVIRVQVTEPRGEVAACVGGVHPGLGGLHVARVVLVLVSTELLESLTIPAPRRNLMWAAVVVVRVLVRAVTSADVRPQDIQLMIEVLCHVAVAETLAVIFDVKKAVGLRLSVPCEVGVVHPVSKATHTIGMGKVGDVLELAHSIH